MLQQIIDTRNKKVKDLEDQARGHRLELGDLRNRTWWQVLNQGLAARIQKKKAINKQYKLKKENEN